MTAQAGQAPGVVKIRRSGAAGDIEVLAGLLSSSPAAEVIDRSAPYPNRHNPGERVYLTVRITKGGQG